MSTGVECWAKAGFECSSLRWSGPALDGGLSLRFWWSPTAARRGCGRGWVDQCLGADVLGDEVGVLAEAVAGALDLDDHGVVQEPVQEGCRDDGIAEHFGLPLFRTG